MSPMKNEKKEEGRKDDLQYSQMGHICVRAGEGARRPVVWLVVVRKSRSLINPLFFLVLSLSPIKILRDVVIES